MKKIALFVTAIAVSLSIGGRVLADTNSATLVDKAGITPDSTILYPIDKAVDNLKISMASGDDKKAKALAAIAEERLGESEIMADKEKTELSNKALAEYTDKITEAQDKIEASIDNTSSSTTDSAIKLDQLEKLEKAIADTQMKSIEVLKNIESKASGNAKETLALVIEMQTRKKEAIAAVAKERQILHEDKKAVKQAEKNLEQAKKAGDEKVIKTAEDTLTQAQLTLTTQKQKFTQVVAAKKEVMKGGVGQLKKEAKKEQTNDAASSTNNTTSEDKATATETAPVQTNDAVTTNTGTATEGTINNNANNTKAHTKVKENKGQEMKANKENNSSNENKGKH